MGREIGGEAEDAGELVVPTVESAFVNPRFALCGLALILAVEISADYLFTASRNVSLIKTYAPSGPVRHWGIANWQLLSYSGIALIAIILTLHEGRGWRVRFWAMPYVGTRFSTPIRAIVMDLH